MITSAFSYHRLTGIKCLVNICLKKLKMFKLLSSPCVHFRCENKNWFRRNLFKK